MSHILNLGFNSLEIEIGLVETIMFTCIQILHIALVAIMVIMVLFNVFTKK